MRKECDNCANGRWVNGKDAIQEICLECRYICGEPTKWSEKPHTNADRIRAMSDEELADFITDKEKGWCTDIGREMYYQHNLEWLKQPAK